MRVKVTVHSMYDVGVEKAYFFDAEPEDLDDNGDLPSYLRDEFWQDAVNDFCSDTSIEIVEDDDE